MANSLTARERAEKIFQSTLDVSQYELYKDLDLDIENLIFEGGGAKSYTYIGVVKALEDLGALQKCKRFCGASAGAMFAAMLAIGMTSNDIMRLLLQDLKATFTDSNYLVMVPNMLKDFGWLPGEKALKLFRQLAKKYTGDADITFRQLYEKRGVELCITVTNVTSGQLEYLHPKTFPHFSVALAVRTSISLPFIYKPVVVERYYSTGDTDKVYLVDGGVSDGFPLNVFDGWYLSMKPEHSFLRMLGTDRPKFDEFNSKTLGILLFDAFDQELYVDKFMARLNYLKDLERPKTQLAKERKAKTDRAMENKVRETKLKNDVDAFLKVIDSHNLTREGSIPVEDFREALGECPECTMKAVFGAKFTDVEDLIQRLDEDSNGTITYEEFMGFAGQESLHIHELLSSIAIGPNLKTLAQFGIAAMHQAGDMERRKLRAKTGDVDRIIGIYTDYISLMDFGMSEKDKVFAMELGWNATMAWLKTRKN